MICDIKEVFKENDRFTELVKRSFYWRLYQFNFAMGDMSMQITGKLRFRYILFIVVVKSRYLALFKNSFLHQAATW